MAYASFGTSWRPGSATNDIILNNVGSRPGSRPAAVEALIYPAPEKSKSYEIGIKTDLLDRRLRVNLTGFYQTFENFAFSSRRVFVGGPNLTNQLQVFTIDPAIAVGVPAEVKGLEAEIQFQPTDRFSLGLVASYSISKIKNGTIPCNDFSPIDGIPDTTSTPPTFAALNAATGGTNKPDGTPATLGRLVQFCKTGIRAGTSAPFSATLTSEYLVPVTPHAEGYLRGLVTYNGDSQNDPTNAFDDIKSYAVVNLFAGIRRPDGGWEFGVYAKNVFDTQRALLRGSNVLNLTVRSPGTSVVNTAYRGVTYTAPREFGATFRVAFGSR
jgi:iron complex outermembrane receptor protein